MQDCPVIHFIVRPFALRLCQYHFILPVQYYKFQYPGPVQFQYSTSSSTKHQYTSSTVLVPCSTQYLYISCTVLVPVPSTIIHPLQYQFQYPVPVYFQYSTSSSTQYKYTSSTVLVLVTSTSILPVQYQFQYPVPVYFQYSTSSVMYQFQDPISINLCHNIFILKAIYIHIS